MGVRNLGPLLSCDPMYVSERLLASRATILALCTCKLLFMEVKLVLGGRNPLVTGTCCWKRTELLRFPCCSVMHFTPIWQMWIECPLRAGRGEACGDEVVTAGLSGVADIDTDHLDAGLVPR